MNKSYSFLESHEWVARIQHPRANSFLTGKLLYRPESGVLFEGFTDLNGYNGSGPILHGVLEDGQPCTLYANIDVTNSGISINGGVALHKNRWRVNNCIIGYHFNADDLFTGFDVELSNFQEIFFPRGHDEHVPWSGESIHLIDNGNLKVEIVLSGNFSFFSKEVIHSTNAELKKSLQEAIEKVISENQNGLPLLRKNIKFLLRVTSVNEMTIEEVHRQISKLKNYFGLIIYKPISLNQISLLVNDQNDKIHQMPLLYGEAGLNSVTISALKKHTDYHNLHINFGNTDFSVSLGAWYRMSGRYEYFAAKVASFSGPKSLYQLHTEYVLQVTFLESICNELGIEHGKYGLAIKMVSGQPLVDAIDSILGTTSLEDIDLVLSGIRNDIAHFKRDQKYLKKHEKNLGQLRVLLDTSITAHIYKQIKIADECIDQFISNELSFF